MIVHYNTFEHTQSACTSVKMLLLHSPLVNVPLARRSWCHQTVSNVHWMFRPWTVTPSRWRVGSGGQITAHLLLLASSLAPLSSSITSKRLFLLPPPSCKLLPSSPSPLFQWLWAFSTLTAQGILYNRPRPGITMLAILSPCSHAEGPRIWHHSWDCKFNRDDLLRLFRPLFRPFNMLVLVVNLMINYEVLDLLTLVNEVKLVYMQTHSHTHTHSFWQHFVRFCCCCYIK